MLNIKILSKFIKINNNHKHDLNLNVIIISDFFSQKMLKINILQL
jgi:hypothetical protein